MTLVVAEQAGSRCAYLGFSAATSAVNIVTRFVNDAMLAVALAMDASIWVILVCNVSTRFSSCPHGQENTEAVACTCLRSAHG